MNTVTKIKWRDLSQWLIVCGIFTERYYELLILMLVSCINIFVNKEYKVSTNLILLFIILFLYSLSMLCINQYTPYKFLQQYFLLLLFFILYSSYFNLNKNDIPGLFDKYLCIAYFVALLGILQCFIYFLLDINIFSFVYKRITIVIAPHILRANSIIDEASYLSTLLTPAAAYYLLGKDTLSKSEQIRKYIIYGCIFLTFSSVTYLIMTFVIVYKYVFYRKYLFAKIVTLALFVIFIGEFTYTVSTDELPEEKGVFSGIMMKIGDTTMAFKDLDPETFDVLNMSSYATMTNIWVASNSPNRLFGTGLGTHEQNYYATYFSNSIFYGINAAEGYSLFNRIFSEFGLLGILILFILLVKFYNKKSLINISVLFIILTLLIRGGHYTRYGIVFFFYLYYYTSTFPIKRRKF